MELYGLSSIQQNVLIASIIGDGEITKLYKGARRKNNSYREHYGVNQRAYREWKQSLIPQLFYLTPKSQTLRSRSLSLFTQLYPYFYQESGQKQIPTQLLPDCTSPYFLAILYMDDGTLSITKRINHRKQKIYLTPAITLALQNYPRHQLEILRCHIENTFNLSFKYVMVPDGYHYALKFTSVKDTFAFLCCIEAISFPCPSMYYKTNWTWRFNHEKQLLTTQYPNYEVITTDSERYKPYSEEEVSLLTSMKTKGATTKQIAKKLNRTYWSVTYKIKELRRKSLL
ncbi:DNA endonuclease [Bacillus sp. Hm123]|uniref:DNA endonuclease n=1 Tax=Bacillus sp. Hm123 TaxID=3450745 RepID=UPI003F43D123